MFLHLYVILFTGGGVVLFEFELFRMSKCKYLHYYHSPTKLRESNVFTCVHLFTGGHHVIITHDALDLTVQDHAPRLCDIRPSAMRPPSAPRPIRRGTLLLLTSDGHHWRIVQTCSFEEAPPNRYCDLVAEARMVGRRVVCILLECFLVKGTFTLTET